MRLAGVGLTGAAIATGCGIILCNEHMDGGMPTSALGAGSACSTAAAVASSRDLRAVQGSGQVSGVVKLGLLSRHQAADCVVLCHIDVGNMGNPGGCCCCCCCTS